MKQLHPIIAGFLQAKEPLGAVLVKHCRQDQPLESAFLMLSKEFASKEINQELILAIDTAIIEGHPDSNVFLFFVCQVISYYNHHLNQQEKMKSLLLIAKSVISDEILPFIKATYLNQLAWHKHREGEINESKKIMKECISLIDKKEPRANVLLENYMSSVATSGQLKENNEYKLDEIKGLSPENYPKVATSLKIRNCLVTGDYQEGYLLMEELKKYQVDKDDEMFLSFNQILQIISGDFNEANYERQAGKLSALALNCFINGKYEEGMKHYYTLIKDNIDLSHMNLSLSYLPLHFDLCAKKSGKAKLLLQDKLKRGDEFYLDDLFNGRIQLLENDEAGANESFTRLMENIIRYGAMKRLEFELQFAKELNLPIILRLLNGWKSDSQAPILKKKVTVPPKLKVIVKCIELFIGISSAITQVKDLIKKYATLNAPVLVTGETGTGKELVARAIHDEGLFPAEPFLAINCGALTDTLLQSELFGYEAGAFTGAQKQRKGIFEAAGKGTVFLDEFGDISPKLQVSLLRVLEANEIRMIGSTATQKIECKIVIATNVDLQAAVFEKRFREDLFFRLARFEIKLPALRERKDDIPELISYFLSISSNNSGKNSFLSPELLTALTSYHWPGNIRELKNEIERLYIINPGIEILGMEHFDFSHLQANVKMTPKDPQVNSDSHSNLLELVEKDESYRKIIQGGFRIERRHNLLKELFKKHLKLTRNQIMKITNVGPTTATKDLQMLVKEGFILRRTPTKSTSTHYFEINR